MDALLAEDNGVIAVVLDGDQGYFVVRRQGSCGSSHRP